MNFDDVFNVFEMFKSEDKIHMEARSDGELVGEVNPKITRIEEDRSKGIKRIYFMMPEVTFYGRNGKVVSLVAPLFKKTDPKLPDGFSVAVVEHYGYKLELEEQEGYVEFK